MLIINGKLVTWGQKSSILEDHALLVQNGIIQAIGPQATMIEAYPSDERLDARGQYVMPGNICAHTHFYGAFSRGLSIPGRAAEDFPEILAKFWWPLDRSLTPEDVHYSALVCLLDAIRHGTTTLIDHHASPEAINGSLDEIANAVELAGVRACLCYEVTDRNGVEQARAGIAENIRFIESLQRKQAGDARLAAMFGLHASLTLSDDTLSACREAASDEVGFHIHVAEHPADEYDAISKSGMRVVDRLHKLGILGPRSIAVHCVHVDAREIELLAETGTWVSHQPRSNMNNAVGLPEVESMLRAGVKVCLGNDGFSNAMWEEWKTAYLAHKIVHGDPRRLGGDRLVDMAVHNNALLAGQLFPGAPIGEISPGARADLIFVDYHPHTPLTAENLPWQILFGFHESMITTTMVAGRLLMHNRELLTLDEEKITARARELAPLTWQRFWDQFPS